MTAYNRLLDLVTQANLRIITFCTLRRSISNAAAIATSNSPTVTGTIIRPFVDTSLGFDRGCTVILEYVEDLIRAGVTIPCIIVKDEAGRIGNYDEWRQWLKLSHMVLFIAREPHLQMQSLIERLANDLAYGIGARQLGREGAFLHAETVDAFLREGGTAGPLVSLGGYDLASWDISENYIRIADQTPGVSTSVAVGSLLQIIPERIMQEIANFAGIEMHPAMLN